MSTTDPVTNVAVFFATGFEEIEAVTIVDVLRRAEFTVTTVGLAGTTVRGSHDLVVETDSVIDAITAANIDALVLPGGMPGADHLKNCPDLISLIRDVHNAGKPVGAICAAPIVLHRAGILSGRRATCFPAFADSLSDTIHTGERVTIDGNIITGIGAGAALEFSLALVAHFGRPDVAATLRGNMLVV